MGGAVLVVAGGWSAGIVLGSLVPLPALVLVLAAMAVLGAVLLAPSPQLRLLGLGLMALLLGQVRVELVRSTALADPLPAFAGEVVLSGRIVEAPLPRGGRVEAVVE